MYLDRCVISVNAGAPQTVTWKRRTFITAIVKTAVEGRVAVRGVNVAGDSQADRRVHGGQDKALYAYASADYSWWEEQLGKKLAPGTFGENLTLQGVDVSHAFVGERWRVGTALLEVTQPRIPCFKLAWRMGDTGFERRFGRALRFGAYLRVIEEGDVGRGDAVAIEARPSAGLSMARFGEIYLFDRAGAAALLNYKQVSDDWRDWAEKQLT